MGSTSYNVPDGQSRKDSAVDYFTNDAGWVVHHASTKGRVVYAACSVRPNRTDFDPNEIFGVVALTSQNKADYYNFTIKVMTDTMGPGYGDCPAKILDMLTPTDNEFANSWRAACRALHRQRAEARKVKTATKIRLAEPLSFTDGVDRDTFTYLSGSKFLDRDGVPVTITRWRDRDFTIIPLVNVA